MVRESVAPTCEGTGSESEREDDVSPRNYGGVPDGNLCRVETWGEPDEMDGGTKWTGR